MEKAVQSVFQHPQILHAMLTSLCMLRQPQNHNAQAVFSLRSF